MDETRWRGPEWLAGAHTWIEHALGEAGVRRAGDIEQPQLRCSSETVGCSRPR